VDLAVHLVVFVALVLGFAKVVQWIDARYPWDWRPIREARQVALAIAFGVLYATVFR